MKHFHNKPVHLACTHEERAGRESSAKFAAEAIIQWLSYELRHMNAFKAWAFRKLKKKLTKIKIFWFLMPLKVEMDKCPLPVRLTEVGNIYADGENGHWVRVQIEFRGNFCFRILPPNVDQVRGLRLRTKTKLKLSMHKNTNMHHASKHKSI